MLEELMRECRNWFVSPNGVHLGTFTVKEGSITLPFLVYGQYFRIVGSVFNDGVYEYGNVSLQDETFEGAVWALSVPPAFIKFSEEIQEWRDSNEKAANSPYTSESFAGYSYTKSSGNGAQGDTGSSWQSIYAKRLAKWRKL